MNTLNVTHEYDQNEERRPSKFKYNDLTKSLNLAYDSRSFASLDVYDKRPILHEDSISELSED